MKAKLKKLIIALFLAPVVLLTVQNIGSVDVYFLNYSFHAPKAIMIALVFLLGVAIGWFIAWKKFSKHTVTDA